MHLSPAVFVIYIFNGVNNTARAIGRTPGSVSRWQKGDGVIPPKVQPIILAEAKRRGLDLTAEDLILGRKVRTSK